MEFDSVKKIYINSELEIAIRLIDNGLAGIQSLNHNGNFLFHPLLLLSQGFERFFKVYILLVDYEKNGIEPNNDKLRGLGHKLTDLKDEILNNYFEDEDLPFTYDKQFLQNDELVGKLFNIFDFFANQRGRYFNLNAICGEIENSSPDSEYSYLEIGIIKDNEYLSEMLNEYNNYDDVKNTVTNNIVVCIEKITRSFLRQFTMTRICPTGFSAYAIYAHFVTLSDDKLGKTNYKDYL